MKPLSFFKRKKQPSPEDVALAMFYEMGVLIDGLTTAARHTVTEDFQLTEEESWRFLDLAQKEFLALPRPSGLKFKAMKAAITEGFNQAHKQALLKHFSFTPAMGDSFIKQLEVRSER